MSSGPSSSSCTLKNWFGYVLTYSTSSCNDFSTYESYAVAPKVSVYESTKVVKKNLRDACNALLHLASTTLSDDASGAINVTEH